MSSDTTRLLILGGTGEGRALGNALVGDGRFTAIYSVAGRTKAPLLPDLECRIGGFGGAGGLARFLDEKSIDILVDATHPFAAVMSANGAAAAKTANVPLIAIKRPAWVAGTNDRWAEVADMNAAASAIGEKPQRVFLTIGKKDLSAFRAMPHHHYVIRAVDPPGSSDLPPDHTIIIARGPFSAEDDIDLLRAHRIDVVVTKNSGGTATDSKLIAARALELPVIMVDRPPLEPATARFESVTGALGWLVRHHEASLPTDRGV